MVGIGVDIVLAQRLFERGPKPKEFTEQVKRLNSRIATLNQGQGREIINSQITAKSLKFWIINRDISINKAKYMCDQHIKRLKQQEKDGSYTYDREIEGVFNLIDQVELLDTDEVYYAYFSLTPDNRVWSSQYKFVLGSYYDDIEINQEYFLIGQLVLPKSSPCLHNGQLLQSMDRQACSYYILQLVLPQVSTYKTGMVVANQRYIVIPSGVKELQYKQLIMLLHSSYDLAYRVPSQRDICLLKYLESPIHIYLPNSLERFDTKFLHMGNRGVHDKIVFHIQESFHNKYKNRINILLNTYHAKLEIYKDDLDVAKDVFDRSQMIVNNTTKEE